MQFQCFYFSRVESGFKKQQKSTFDENILYSEKESSKMKKYKKILVEEVKENLVKLISKDWFLISAGSEIKGNSMTASWGFIGHMWYKDVAMCVVRPQRYTHEFLEENDTFALSFFGPEYKKELGLFGTKSGREIDKIHGGLTAAYHNETLYYEEAKLVLFCKKVYKAPFLKESFMDTEIPNKCYPENDFHTMFYGEILEVWERE